MTYMSVTPGVGVCVCTCVCTGVCSTLSRGGGDGNMVLVAREAFVVLFSALCIVPTIVRLITDKVSFVHLISAYGYVRVRVFPGWICATRKLWHWTTHNTLRTHLNVHYAGLHGFIFAYNSHVCTHTSLTLLSQIRTDVMDDCERAVRGS